MAVMESMLTGGGPVTPAQSAEAALRAVCGWHVAPIVTETLTRDGNGRSTLKLPTEHIVAVSEVRIDGRRVEGVRWSQAGMLQGVRFPRRFRAVEVDLTHGYDPAEVADVIGIVQGAAQRAASIPGAMSESVAGASIRRWDHDGGPLTHLLTRPEQAALAPYLLTWGP